MRLFIITLAFTAVLIGAGACVVDEYGKRTLHPVAAGITALGVDAGCLFARGYCASHSADGAAGCGYVDPVCRGVKSIVVAAAGAGVGAGGDGGRHGTDYRVLFCDKLTAEDIAELEVDARTGAVVRAGDPVCYDEPPAAWELDQGGPRRGEPYSDDEDEDVIIWFDADGVEHRRRVEPTPMPEPPTPAPRVPTPTPAPTSHLG